ncbi:MAG: DNA translocase FtsK 4TM domain-containing protein, partial [Anaerolineae bacterium]|nr:DNA translocase FtsK 4TM domain-containing protein [Anaerolineae bacterium]
MTRRKTNTSQSSRRSTSSSRSTSSRSTSQRKTNTRSARGGSRGGTTRRRTRSQQPIVDFSALLQAEVLGIVLLAVALLTLLSFISFNQGQFIGGWLHLLRQGFGWGAFLMPAAFGSIGLALLMHGFGRLPPIGAEKIVGAFLLFITALGLTHLIATPPEITEPWILVVDGRAGGLLGYLVGEGMSYTLGRIGAYVTVIAFLCIGLVLTLGMSPAEIGIVLWNWWGQLRVRIPSVQINRPQRTPSEPQYVINGRNAPKTPAATEPPPSIREQPTPDKRPAAPKVEIASPPHSQPEAEPKLAHPLFSISRPSQPKAANVQWKLPPLAAILEDLSDQEISEAEIANRVQVIERTLESFGVPARVVEVNQGPVITQFGVEPGFTAGRGGKQTKVKVSRIASLADDLSLALAAAPIRIEAPVPGRSIVGIEVPNQEVAMVSLRGVMETETFKQMNQKSPLPIALGEDVSGEAVVADLVAMPHLLIAGATGSGKSVCINA